jgi:CheY-like chemotaxis protein
MQMPILDGYEATRQLRGLGFRQPILALTAYASPENRAECLGIGCDGHLSKPIDWSQLMAFIRGSLATETSRGGTDVRDGRGLTVQ